MVTIAALCLSRLLYVVYRCNDNIPVFNRTWLRYASVACGCRRNPNGSISEWCAPRYDKSPPSGMIVILIWKWLNDRHLKKPCRFIIDLLADLSASFQYDRRPSFRYDGMAFFSEWRGAFRDDCPCSLISESGGFTSYHHENNYHFSRHKKLKIRGIWKFKKHLKIIPKFYHSEE